MDEPNYLNVMFSCILLLILVYGVHQSTRRQKITYRIIFVSYSDFAFLWVMPIDLRYVDIILRVSLISLQMIFSFSFSSYAVNCVLFYAYGMRGVINFCFPKRFSLMTCHHFVIRQKLIYLMLKVFTFGIFTAI